MSDQQTSTDTPKLSWDEQATMVPVTSEAELMQRLDELAAQAGETPPIVELYQPDGSSLSIGVGRERSVVVHIESVDQPDWISSGDPSRGELPVFYFHGHHSEFPPGSAVPVEDAIEAMRRFYSTGQRPDNIAWQQ